jgi:hypothetical protein
VGSLGIELVDKLDDLGANRLSVASHTVRALRVGGGQHVAKQPDLLRPAISVRCAAMRAGYLGGEGLYGVIPASI